jgi:DNA repair exonuclease SbcCD ATPase subunit
LNDETNFKSIHNKNDNIDFTFDCSKKVCARLLAAQKIDMEHQLELNNLKHEHSQLLMQEVEKKSKEIDDYKRESYESFKAGLAENSKRYDEMLQKKDAELKKKEQGIESLKATIQEKFIKIEELKKSLNIERIERGTSKDAIDSLKQELLDIVRAFQQNSTILDEMREKSQASIWSLTFYRNLFGGAFLVCFASFFGYVLKTHPSFA